MTVLLLVIVLPMAFYAQEIPSVSIGGQVWMKRNLDVDKFRNGDPVSQAKTQSEWNKANAEKRPAWCYYEFDVSNGEVYGKIYNHYAVTDPRGLAPAGWRIPNDQDWQKLIDFLGGDLKAGESFKGEEGWEGDGNGTNASGFNGLPGGYMAVDGGYDRGEGGYWWSSTIGSKTGARNVGSSANNIVGLDDTPKTMCYSVRCIKE